MISSFVTDTREAGTQKHNSQEINLSNKTNQLHPKHQLDMKKDLKIQIENGSKKL